MQIIDKRHSEMVQAWIRIRKKHQILLKIRPNGKTLLQSLQISKSLRIHRTSHEHREIIYHKK